MAQRLIQLVTQATLEELRQSLQDCTIDASWTTAAISDDVLEVSLLVDMGASEDVLDALEHAFAERDPFNVVLLNVGASLPRPEEIEDEDANAPKEVSQDQADESQAEAHVSQQQVAPQASTENESADTPDETPDDDSLHIEADIHISDDDGSTYKNNEDEADDPQPNRVSREELYNDINDSIGVSWQYVTMVVLSTVVATAGMLRDNVAIIIGAMVIAPLLGPNIALSLATTLADVKLARRTIGINLLGLTMALALAVGFGMLFPVSLTSLELASRTQVSLADIGIALASGVAGALAFTTGASTATIGVMVAVALLPPWVAVGVLLGEGYNHLALGALSLFGCNVICVNLAGVGTFLVQGLRPADSREAKQAKLATFIAITVWVLLLAALAALISFSDVVEPSLPE